jgi:uncharacterized membrane protein (DUF485 family)
MDNGNDGGPHGRALQRPRTEVPDAHAIAQTGAFRDLVTARARFSVPVALLGFGAYLVIIVFSGFTTVLSGPAIGALSWTAVLTALVFPLVWLLCSLYRRQAQRWDALAERAAVEARDGSVRS